MSESKIADKTNQSEVGEYGISFTTRKESGALDIGHALIFWYHSDTVSNKTMKRAAGFI